MHAIVPTAQARRLGDAACTWSVPTLSTTVRDAKRYKRLQAGGTVAAVGLFAKLQTNLGNRCGDVEGARRGQS
jgi:hypothetical protein